MNKPIEQEKGRQLIIMIDPFFFRSPLQKRPKIKTITIIKIKMNTEKRIYDMTKRDEKSNDN